VPITVTNKEFQNSMSVCVTNKVPLKRHKLRLLQSLTMYEYIIMSAEIEDELKTARGHMIPPPQHMCNGLASPACRARIYVGTKHRNNGT